MFKRLRRRVVVMIMIVVFASLVIIFSLMYASTKQSLIQQCQSRLDNMLSGQIFEHTPGSADGGTKIPAFSVLVNQRSEITLEQNDFYTLDNDLLLQIVTEAYYSGSRSGRLEDYALRYRVQPTVFGTKIAFADTSIETSTLKSLVVTSAFLGLGIMIAFFIASLFISKLIVRPIARAWEKQRDFVADASHELKTPLTVIIANSEMLVSSPDESVEARQKWAENVKEESGRMRRLVEALLELARADAEPLEKCRETLDFSYIVNECLLEFEPVLFEDGKSLASGIQDGLRVRGERDRLKQLIAILIDNARKYSDPGSTVLVELLASGKREMALKVTDSGPEIPTKDREKIFDRFYRGDTSREANGSYGLGLSIAKSITEQHGGKISADSADGKTTFTVILPAEK